MAGWRGDPNGDRRGQITDLVSIRQRPATVEDRAVPGHWEGDLLSGSQNSYIATLVERHTRYVMLAKVTNKDAMRCPPGGLSMPEVQLNLHEPAGAVAGLA